MILHTNCAQGSHVAGRTIGGVQSTRKTSSRTRAWGKWYCGIAVGNTPVPRQMTESRPFWVVGAVGAGWTFGALPLHFVETDVMEVFCIKFAIFR